jgi:hypothetical protein
LALSQGNKTALDRWEDKMASSPMIVGAITDELLWIKSWDPELKKIMSDVLFGEFTSETIDRADVFCSTHSERPDWVSAIAGGNKKYLAAVREIAIEDWIATIVTLIDD